MNHKESTIEEINEVMEVAEAAFLRYRKTPPDHKAKFLDTIASEIEALGDPLVLTASEETNLPVPRLMGERGRTLMQLRMFAEMVREGSWVDASIDTAIPSRTPAPRPDIRKLHIPLGPVIVFGASNFPFAYSTAGGDTASALAAGCPVVVKAHPGHSETSYMVAQAIKKAIAACDLPPGVFQHVYGSFEVGKALVQHPVSAAVGFTGSFTGGNALVNYARDRKSPIPVFAEMGSINPVVLFPDTLQRNYAALAKAFGESVTLSMGQFCTNPGLMLAVESEGLDEFLHLLSVEVQNAKPAKMLNSGIYNNYRERMHKSLDQPGVQHEQTAVETGEMEALPGIASVDADTFMQNHFLQEEVFGPYSLVVKCKDMEQLKDAWKMVKGQLTTSLIGTEKDFADNQALIDLAEQVAGRLVFNGVPTGVEVCPAMVHGGPYPASTDSRFVAVGIHSVKRWVRPVCFQSCPDNLLPEELQNNNPRNIWRLVNNEWTRAQI